MGNEYILCLVRWAWSRSLLLFVFKEGIISSWSIDRETRNFSSFLFGSSPLFLIKILQQFTFLLALLKRMLSTKWDILTLFVLLFLLCFTPVDWAFFLFRLSTGGRFEVPGSRLSLRTAASMVEKSSSSSESSESERMFSRLSLYQRRLHIWTYLATMAAILLKTAVRVATEWLAWATLSVTRIALEHSGHIHVPEGILVTAGLKQYIWKLYIKLVNILF